MKNWGVFFYGEIDVLGFKCIYLKNTKRYAEVYNLTRVRVCNLFMQKSDNKPSQPRYLVLTRTVKMLPTEYQKGREMKEVYTYNDFGYEDSFILYVDGENVEQRKNYKHDELGRVLHWEALPRMGGKG